MNTFIFSETSEAYDDCQCNEQLENGDVLVIADEGVVGICDTWPFAITVKGGCLHKIRPGSTAGDLAKALGLTVDQLLASLRAAVVTATHQRFEIDPTIATLIAA